MEPKETERLGIGGGALFALAGFLVVGAGAVGAVTFLAHEEARHSLLTAHLLLVLLLCFCVPVALSVLLLAGRRWGMRSLVATGLGVALGGLVWIAVFPTLTGSEGVHVPWSHDVPAHLSNAGRSYYTSAFDPPEPSHVPQPVALPRLPGMKAPSPQAPIPQGSSPWCDARPDEPGPYRQVGTVPGFLTRDLPVIAVDDPSDPQRLGFSMWVRFGPACYLSYGVLGGV